MYAIMRELYPSVVDQVMAGVQAEAAAQSWSSVWTGARIRGFDWLWTESGQCLDARTWLFVVLALVDNRCILLCCF